MPLVGKRYAQALFELSEANVEDVRQEFQSFVEIYNSDKDFSSFLIDPRVKSDKKQIVIKNVFAEKLSKNMLNFILLLVAKQRIGLVSEVYGYFVQFINERANVLEMKVISAQQLDEQQLQKIKDKFRVKYKANSVNVENVVDPSIIGGVKVIIGDKVFDGSIKGRIEALAELVNL